MKIQYFRAQDSYFFGKFIIFLGYFSRALAYYPYAREKAPLEMVCLCRYYE